MSTKKQSFLLLAILLVALFVFVTPAMAATTQVHVVKYANDGTTILNETTKTYQWMEANLPVLGDGVTHYYHQGPVFVDDPDPVVEQELRWNPDEDTNEKDQGAVKGTNLKDICDLVGGMNAGETVKLRSSDGFSKTFAYENVYSYPARQGPMVITWYMDGLFPDTGYSDGMKLVFFADDSVNPWGYHMMGNYDWHESAASQYWYYYSSGTEQYPTTSGLSNKIISEVLIYSDDAPPAPVAPIAAFSGTPVSGNVPLTVKFTDASTGTGPFTYAWDFNNDGVTDNTTQSPSFTYTAADTYSVKLTVTSAAGSDDETKTGYISVTSAPTLNVLFDGTVVLVPGETFSKTAYNSGTSYTINKTTPLGALQMAATSAGFSYEVTDKRWSYDQVLLLDNVSTYTKATGKWYAYVNDVYKDGYGSHANGLNVIDLADNDKVEYYYAAGITTPSDLNAVKAAATAAVKTVADIQAPGPTLNVLFDGTVILVPGETFSKTAYNSGTSYTINKTTPLGALQMAATSAGFSYEVTDKRWSYDQVLLLDNVSTYTKATGKWYAYVNDVYKDGYGSHANGLNVIDLADNDKVEYYYAAGITTPSDLNAVKAAATAAVKTVADIQAPGPTLNVLFDGTVILVPGETFSKTAYNSGTSYTINKTTPLGALQMAATSAGFSYEVTDKRWSYDQVLLLDNVSTYTKATGKWYAYVNDIYKDGYGSHANGLNVIDLADNDKVEYYYAAGITTPSDLTAVKAAATAAVKTVADIQAPGPVVDTIFDGTVTLTPGETFTVQAYNNLTGGLYTVNRTTPLGALDKVATLQGINYNVTDKRWQYDQVLLLDDVGNYLNKKPNVWYTYVNGVYKDGYGNHANGLNVIELANNDQVNFYYAPNKDPNPIPNATAVIKITVNIGGSEPVPDWTLSMNGAKTTSVTKTFFENGLACPASGHQVFWTDSDGSVWGGVPLWVLVAMVDDNPDVGPDHFNFNDGIAAQGYSVKVVSGDGWDTTLSSQNIARNNSIIVANTLNGTPLPLLTPAGKLSWPLHLKGAAVFGGQQVGNITKIELTGLPQPPTEWSLTLQGDVTDIITQSFFVDAIACKHNVTWTDSSGIVWQGVPLWDLAGAVDDIETSSHYTFNDTRATMGYTIRVSDAVGYNATFASATAAHNDGFFVAYKKNGTALTGSDAPLKLVGPATTSGKQRVGGITKISLEGLADQYPAGNWQLNLNGKISDLIPQGEFEYWAACHSATYTDTNGNVYTGVPLWRLMGWVDDRIPHGPNGFDDAAATAGYKVIVKAGDGYAKEFTSQQIGKTNAFIVANTMNGAPIPNTADPGKTPPYPLRLVGSGVTGGSSVGNVVEIQLTDFQTPVEVPKLHIIKYAGDGTTVINETTIDYIYMENNLPVIGDGTTVYKFEGLTLNSSNLWDQEETYPGGFKISNVVKGSRVRDLTELVGGMGSGTAVTFVASDGFETTLPYSSIYTNPAVQARQGDAILAWWGDGQYVPKYADGMRLFFTPDGDHVYGQWDMHETLPSQYWRYNFQDNVQYPSCAGLSAKYITTVKVYSSPESDWTLELDGQDIGGVSYTVSKPFLEEAIACQFGADHKATYTDSKGRVWEGMPLWFFAGFVDDADQHSPNAYNMTKALAGYNIVITGKDDYTTTLSSRDIIRSSNYLIANSLNGTHIAEEDDSWPLRFTGVNVSGGMTVKGVKSVKLIRIAEPPVADFTATPTTGTVPLTVQFTDVSTGAASWSWAFGDGVTSTSQNPSHMYTAAGTYTATLTVTNPGGSSSKQLQITVTVQPPVANFTATPTTGKVPLAVQFTDASTGATSWSWVFGDGTPTSTDQSPLHTYTEAGDYTAILTVTNDAGSSTKQVTITAQPVIVKKPVAKLTQNLYYGKVPLTIQFTDRSLNDPTSYRWSFGDGSSSTDKNPAHIYKKVGVYFITLKVSNSAGSDSAVSFVVVQPKSWWWF